MSARASILALAAWWPLAAVAGEGSDAPQLLQGSGPGWAYLLQLAGGLIVVVGGIMALAWLMRRVGRFQSGAGGRLRVIDGLSVGTRERVVLVQVGDEQLLLGVAAGQVRMLHALREPLPETPARAPGSDQFARRLAQILNRGGRG